MKDRDGNVTPDALVHCFAAVEARRITAREEWYWNATRY
jgi:hypothetical protein